MEKHHKFSVWYVVLGIWVVLLIQGYLGEALSIKTIPYSRFLSLLNQNKVSEVAVTENRIQGRMKSEKPGAEKGEAFRTIRVDPHLSELLDSHNVTFKGEVQSNFLANIFSWFFPVLLFFGIWYFFMKRMAGQQPSFMSLGKNKAKIYVWTAPTRKGGRKSFAYTSRASRRCRNWTMKTGQYDAGPQKNWYTAIFQREPTTIWPKPPKSPRAWSRNTA